MAWMTLEENVWDTYRDHPLKPGGWESWVDSNPQKAKTYEMVEMLRDIIDASNK